MANRMRPTEQGVSSEKPLGNHLRRARKQARVTLAEAATKTGISRSHIWQLEAGEARNPTLDTLLLLAALYRVSLGELVGESPATPSHVRALKATLNRLTDRQLDTLVEFVESLSSGDS